MRHRVALLIFFALVSFGSDLQAIQPTDDYYLAVYENCFASVFKDYLFDDNVNIASNLDEIVARTTLYGINNYFFRSKELLQQSLERGLKKSSYMSTVNAIQLMVNFIYIYSFVGIDAIEKMIAQKKCKKLGFIFVTGGVLFAYFFFKIFLQKSLKKEACLRKSLQKCSDYSSFTEHFNIFNIEDPQFLSQDYSQFLTADAFNSGVEHYSTINNKLKFCYMVMHNIGLKCMENFLCVYRLYQMHIAKILILLPANICYGIKILDLCGMLHMNEMCKNIVTIMPAIASVAALILQLYTLYSSVITYKNGSQKLFYSNLFETVVLPKIDALLDEQRQQLNLMQQLNQMLIGAKNILDKISSTSPVLSKAAPAA